ncbi:MAG TPA: hypothetical protein VMX17_10210 [Candidatus Glassbacteria bacterium]|nr:hypothetical protein [Candidatus Glassbacteria bacterium]
MVDDDKTDSVNVETKKSGINKIYVIIIVALIIFAIIPTSVTVPYKKLEKYQESYTEQETYEVQVPYDVQLSKQVQVPYDDIEYYTESEPYIDIVPISFSIVEARYDNYFLTPPSYVWVTIKNGDTTSGTFSVKFDITTVGGATITKYANEYILSGEEKQVKASLDDKVKTYQYYVTPPTKEVTKYHDVQKSRTVTKYRQETQYFTETQYSTETSTRDVTKTRPAERYVTDLKQKNVLMIQKIFGLY